MAIILDVLLLISYNCPVWVPKCERNANKLERIQWRSIKVFMPYIALFYMPGA